MFKVGDKIVCIDDSPLIGVGNEPIPRGLTKYKTYTIIRIKHNVLFYFILDDGREGFDNIERFIPLTEFRKLKIDKIKKGLI